MINIKTFSCNMLQENTYVVSDETLQAVVIDCGAFYPEERQAIVDYLRNNQLRPVHLLCTHGHLDHCFGNDTLYSEFQLQPQLHAADEFLARDMAEQARNLFGFDYDRPTPPIGHFIANGECIGFGTHQFKALHTPGHTPGGLVYYCAEEGVAFTGDTLFRMSIGRTDFDGGSWTDMQHSLRSVLAQLPPATKVYPGHGPTTTIATELEYNPYMK